MVMNLKYAMRAGSDVTLECIILDIERRSSPEMCRLKITDYNMTSYLVLFGCMARAQYAPNDRIVAQPVWYNEQYGNFVLKRGGTVRCH